MNEYRVERFMAHGVVAAATTTIQYTPWAIKSATRYLFIILRNVGQF